MGTTPPASAPARERGLRRRRLQAFLRRYPRAAGAACAAVGVLVLVGWWLGVDPLAWALPSWPFMAPSTALMTVLAGVSLVLLAPEPPARPARIAGVAAAAVVGLIALWSLVAYAINPTIDIDRLFPHARTPTGDVPGQSSPHSAVAFLFTSLALLCLSRPGRERVKPGELLALAAGAIPITALLGYLFSVPALYTVSPLMPHRGIAIHSAAVLIVLSTGILAARPATGIMAVVASNQAGGTMARRLLLSLVALVPAGFALGYGQRLGWYDPPVTAALFITLALIEGVVFILLTANRLNNDDDAREAAEAQLRRSEERFRELFEQASDGVFISDLAGRYTDVNEAGARLIGYRPEELLGRTIPEFLRPEELGRLAEQKDRLLAGDTRVGEWDLRHRDGHWVPTELSAKILSDGRWQAVVRDITERKRKDELEHLEQAERARSLNEQSFLARVGEVLASSLSFRDTLENVAELVVGFLGDTCAVDVVEDDGSLRRLKVAHSGLANEPLMEALRRGAPAPSAAHPKVMSERRAQVVDDLPSELRALGMKSLLAVPLVARGRLIGLLWVACCMMEHRHCPADVRLAEELGRRVAMALDNAHLYEIANEAIQTRDQVLGIVAHDLRAPLGAILLHLDRTRPPRGQPERRSLKHVDAIRKATTRMDRLIQNLLDVRRLEAGHLDVDRRPVATGELVAEAVEAARSAAADADIDLRVDVPDHLPDVMADRDRLLQVFDNLIGNAIKFTGEGGRIDVAVRAGGGGDLVFRVADDGQGIRDEDLPHLFEPFWQALKGDRRGAGLGLPIVRGIVEAHGGHISVSSRFGSGTAFTFTIPAARPGDVRDMHVSQGH